MAKQSPEFRLPPFTVQRVYATALAETVDWGLKLLGVPDEWVRTKGKGARVAVLDTGVDMFHVEKGDLEKAVVATADFSRSRFGWQDRNGHGTHCAGVIGARHNDRGVVGIAPECELMIGKVLGDDGSGSSLGIAQGIDWAVSYQPHIISMSLGSSQPDGQIHGAILRAVKKGIYVICAAGNEGPGPRDTTGWPGRFEETVSVGAVGRNREVAPFSSRGKAVDVCAPGVDVLSTYLMGQYAKLSGSSMSCPAVAGVVALMVAHKLANKEPLLTPAELTQHLRDTADKWPPGQGGGSGTGIVNPRRVIGIDRPAEGADKPLVSILGLKIYSPGRAGDALSISIG